MKIICIGRNYADHAKELNNSVPSEPVVFLKPDTCLLKEGKPFYIPEFSNNVQHEIELVVKISKTGKHIAKEFAHKYYNEIGLGIDFTARDIQQECKEKGLPWEKAKAFDSSSPIGNFISKSEIKDLNAIDIELKKNENTIQIGNTREMLFSIDSIIAHVSKYFTLKVGDLIYTGTPAGVGPVKEGDKLKGFLNNSLLLEFEVK